MAESIVVNLILNKLIPVIENYVQNLSGLKDDLEFIKQELEWMRAFLSIADAQEANHQNDQTEIVWAKQVRKVAHDIEDVLDEYMFSSAHPDQEDGCNIPLLKIKSSIRNFKARCRITSSLQPIKATILTISEGHSRYVQQQNQASPSTGAYNVWYDPRVDALLEEVDPVGIETPRKQLIEWLESSDPERKVFPVVGMGGIGKTTLVKEVYDDPEIKNGFTNHIWITLSKSFKIEKVLKHIMQQLKYPFIHGLQEMDNSLLKEKINQFLLESKYLLVVDDIWSTDDWDAIIVAFPNNKMRSRVMITTRNTDIASSSSFESGRNELSLQRLSDKDSWKLFVKKTFLDICPEELEETCRSILTTCEGLPLAIVAISGMLATKDRDNIDEWESINKSLNALMKESSKLKRAESILSLSYNDLPYHLKSCFLYLSVFPEHYEIECSRLIRLWVAEGFVHAMGGRTLEEEAKILLRELRARNLIQVSWKSSDGRVRMCHIHNFLREIIISKASYQNIADIATKDTIHDSKQVRRLSLHNTLLERQPLKKDRQIRSLFMFGKIDQLSKSSMPILFCGVLRLLTVLELKDAHLDTFPDAVVKLYHLRYLSLRNTKVSMIPESIHNLQNLETLDLKHTDVTRLPIQIFNLKLIHHILVYRYIDEPYKSYGSKFGFQVPSDTNIRNLKNLQKLCFIEADQPTSRNMVSQLEQLTQLRRLDIKKIKTEDGEALCSTISKLINLRALSLMSKSDTDVLDLKSLSKASAPKTIQRLYLVGPLEYLPPWISSLVRLVKVSLKWSRLREEPLESLQGLPNLVHLELLQVYGGKCLRFKANTFKTLKLLIIDNFDALESVIIENNAMPNLENLTIQRCELLESVPSGIEGLTRLKVLEFFGMTETFISTIHPDKKGADSGKVAHIPEVYSNNWVDNRWKTDTLRRTDKAYQPSTVLK